MRCGSPPHHAAALAALAIASPLSAQTPEVVRSDALASFRHGIMYFHDTAYGARILPFDPVNAILTGGGLFDDIRLEPTLDVPALPNLVIGVVSPLPEGITQEVTSRISHLKTDGQMLSDQSALVFDETLEIDALIIDGTRPNDHGSYRFRVETDTEVLYDLTFTPVPADTYDGVFRARLVPG